VVYESFQRTKVSVKFSSNIIYTLYSATNFLKNVGFGIVLLKLFCDIRRVSTGCCQLDEWPINRKYINATENKRKCQTHGVFYYNSTK